MKKEKMTELDRFEEIIFNNGGRQISRKELKEIQSRLKKTDGKIKVKPEK